MASNAMAAGLDVVAVIVVLLLAVVVLIDAGMQLHERFAPGPRARRAAILANLRRGLDEEARDVLKSL